MENSRAIHEKRFYNLINKLILAPNSVRMTREKINKFIKNVKSSKNEWKKGSYQYWLLNRYDVLTVDGRDNLIYPVTKANSEVKYYCAIEGVFDVLFDTHIEI